MILITGLAGSITVQAETFTHQDFLALPEAHQKFWIEGAIDVVI
ncbi:hypothetical protein [Gynuella sp.]